MPAIAPKMDTKDSRWTPLARLLRCAPDDLPMLLEEHPFHRARKRYKTAMSTKRPVNALGMYASYSLNRSSNRW